MLGFVNKFVDGTGDVTATDKGDGAVGTTAVTSFGYLEVSVVSGSGEGATGCEGRRLGGLRGKPLDVCQQLVPLVDPKPSVDLRKLLLQLGTVALNKAPGGDERAATPVGMMAAVEPCTVLYLLQDGIDRLFLGIAYETTGIEDNDIAVILHAVEKEGVPSMAQMSGEVFGIDGVLAASEGDDIDFHGNRRL